CSTIPSAPTTRARSRWPIVSWASSSPACSWRPTVDRSTSRAPRPSARSCVFGYRAPHVRRSCAQRRLSAAPPRAVRREPLAIPLREARAPLVLALDIGTSGLRVFLFDSRGRPVAGCIAHADRPVRTAADGEVTVDADERVRAACLTIDAVLARAGRRASEIAAVAASTFWHSLVGVDAGGRPTTRVLTWADTRARGAAAALRRELDPIDTHARRWPALADARWVPAIGDGACSNVGAGAIGRDTASLFLGTSGAMRVVYATDDPPIVEGGWTYRLDASRVVAGGALSNGGNVLTWLARTFPGVDVAA